MKRVFANAEQNRKNEYTWFYTCIVYSILKYKSMSASTISVEILTWPFPRQTPPPKHTPHTHPYHISF